MDLVGLRMPLAEDCEGRRPKRPCAKRADGDCGSSSVGTEERRPVDAEVGPEAASGMVRGTGVLPAAGEVAGLTDTPDSSAISSSESGSVLAWPVDLAPASTVAILGRENC
jgi:hypothetical protein